MQCPTCQAKALEVYEGAYEWQPSTFKYAGKDWPCDCEEQVALYRRYLLARIGEEYMRYTWVDFYGDELGRELAEYYMDNWTAFNQHGIGLSFYGPQGNGKTFLSMWIARELVKRGEKVHCISFKEAIDIFTLPIEKRMEAEVRVRESNVLFLDEVTGAVSEAQRALFADQFENIMRHRSNYGKITFFTTNLQPHEFKAFFPRVYSLACVQSKMHEIVGDDSRQNDIAAQRLEAAVNHEAKPIC